MNNTQNEVDFFKGSRFDLAVIAHTRRRFGLKGEVAYELMKHFAIVAAREEGEDSAGRQAMKLQTPEEIVNRACDIADQFVNKCETMGWIIEVPAIQDLKDFPK